MGTSIQPRTIHSELHLVQHPSWSHLTWLAHGFSTRPGGMTSIYRDGVGGELNLGFTPADDRELVLKNRELLLHALPGGSTRGTQLKTLTQIHSSTVHAVNESDRVPAGDAMVTATPGVYCAIQTADCVPVLLVDERRRVVAAVHAGWRGTVQRIVEVTIQKMGKDFGSHPADMLALIGPSIGSCCYLVGDDLRQEFATAFSYADDLFSSKNDEEQGRVALDLWEANRRQLVDSGLKPENIQILGECTSCHPEDYFSHRQSGGRTGRMMGVVGIRREEEREA